MVSMISVRWLPVIINKYVDSSSRVCVEAHLHFIQTVNSLIYFSIGSQDLKFAQMTVVNGCCNFAAEVAPFSVQKCYSSTPSTSAGQSELRFAFRSP